jgi:hypothetical protein
LANIPLFTIKNGKIAPPPFSLFKMGEVGRGSGSFLKKRIWGQRTFKRPPPSLPQIPKNGIWGRSDFSPIFVF